MKTEYFDVDKQADLCKVIEPLLYTYILIFGSGFKNSLITSITLNECCIYYNSILFLNKVNNAKRYLLHR